MSASTSDIHGVCHDDFAAVREAFAANFTEDRELGASFSLCVEGETVVDLWAGFADRAQTAPFTETTLTPVFSTTKALAALMVAKLVDEERLAYDQPVVEIWPEFGQAGKAGLTLEQVMSHQAGLCGFVEPMEPSLWFDWDGLCAKLAAAAPLWPPGSASGYHPVTFGYLAGEIFRRLDGRTLGAALHEDFAVPFDLDLWIGLPDAEHARVAEMRRPPAPPQLGPITEAKRAAFLTPWAAPGGRDSGEWRRAEIPSANGHATARALARIAGVLANDGMLDGRRVFSQGLAHTAAKQRIVGEDLVLPYRISWGAGFMRNEGLNVLGPGRKTFGHYGWGGSCVFADPERRLSGAYVMNRQSADLIGDARARRLIDAAYAAG